MDQEQTNAEAPAAPEANGHVLQSPETDKLAEALAKAQAKMEEPVKNKKATIEGKSKSSGKPYNYSYDYADLPAVIKSLKAALAENELSYTQPTKIVNDKMRLETKLMHSSGQWIAGEWPLKTFEDPKETAAHLTLVRRYTLTSLCGISAEETDDDAERRSSGKGEPVIGQLTKSKLQARMREFDTMLHDCHDEGELAGLLESYKDDLAQCERDMPSWYYTQENSDSEGVEDRINRKKRQFAIQKRDQWNPDAAPGEAVTKDA